MAEGFRSPADGFFFFDIVSFMKVGIALSNVNGGPNQSHLLQVSSNSK